mmetsp:Transcript_64887/g.107630  ORF Transcript_64887/g.107630 Transcript_64887/m.107630 type:complete len:271 (+) Transcript_64887:2407-3219(+)
MEDGIGAPDVLQVGVESSIPVVRAGRLREQQTHGITLVTESGLNTHEEVTELLPVHQHVLAISVQVSWWWSPALMQPILVWGELLVLRQWHAVSHVQLGAGILGFTVVHNHLKHLAGRFRQTVNGVALPLHLLGQLEQTAKHIQVRSRTNVALIWRETEDGDGQLLILLGGGAELGPLHHTANDGLSAVLQSVGLTGVAVTSRHDHGLNGTVQLRNGDLKCNLHRVQTQGRLLPLLSCLENKRQGHHVRAVQLGQGLDGLGVVLTGGASN